MRSNAPITRFDTFRVAVETWPDRERREVVVTTTQGGALATAAAVSKLYDNDPDIQVYDVDVDLLDSEGTKADIYFPEYGEKP